MEKKGREDKVKDGRPNMTRLIISLAQEQGHGHGQGQGQGS